MKLLSGHKYYYIVFIPMKDGFFWPSGMGSAGIKAVAIERFIKKNVYIKSGKRSGDFTWKQLYRRGCRCWKFDLEKGMVR